MANFSELNNEQRRQLIDATQAFQAWRAAEREFRHGYRGRMNWKTVQGTQYLYRIVGTVQKSLGPRSQETERIKHDYVDQRTRLKQRLRRLDERLKAMERINRAFGLGRMPLVAAKVLRKIDQAGLLGSKLFLVGTHALYAYEARAGLVIEGGLTSTRDVDLLLDSRQHLSLALAEDLPPDGVMGLLRSADKSFERTDEFRATNDDGYFVDLIAPMRPNEMSLKAQKLIESNDDLAAASILGLQWLINAPKFEEVCVAEDGRPLFISCIDPRAFALHKFWVSQQVSREPQKRRRDAEQARAVAELAVEYLGMKFKASDLSALPLQLVKAAKQLVAETKKRPSTPTGK